MKLNKHIGKIVLMCLIGLLFSACRKDYGNYEYKEINDLVVTGIQGEYEITAGQNINIIPVLEFSKDPNYAVDKYTFEWISFNLAASQPEQRKSLHTGKDFVMQFPLGIGNYTLFYVVKEKSTGISWQKEFKVKVVGTYKGGWGVLSEVSGNSRLDYFEYDHSTGTYPKTFRDFTSLFADQASGKVLTISGKPKFLTGWYNRTDATGAAVNKYFLYIGTENATEKLNLTDGFIWSEKYAFKFETAGSQALPLVHNIWSAGAGQGYAYLDGDVFLRMAVFQYAFGTPINRLSGNASIFKVSPFTAVSINYTSSPTILMYDVTNKRFVRNAGGSAVSTSPLPYTAGVSAFDPNNVGMDLVWMGHTFAYAGRAYAVLKDNTTNKYYLARMNNAVSFSAYAMDEITTLPEIEKATQFAVDQQYGYLHYSVGGKLYQYDVDSKATKIMKDYGSDVISLLKYNQGTAVTYTTAVAPANAATYGKRFIEVTTGLICATYNPANPNTSGKVEVFNVPQFNASFTLFNTFDGFGKVADVTAAEFPYGW